MSHPFALVLSTRGGWNTDSIATFREAADLWTFYGAWLEAVENEETKREARFCHIGRAVQHVHPHDTHEAFQAWVADRKARRA